MNATKAGLYEAIDFMDDDAGTVEALQDAGSLASQSAGIALLCALALDAVAYGDCEQACDPSDVAGIASRLMFKCWDDLTVAVNIMS